jgi:hypothetical protein
VDAALIEPTPRGILDATTGRVGRRARVLFLDSIEHIAALHGWLREQFLPNLQRVGGSFAQAGSRPKMPGATTCAGRRCRPCAQCSYLDEADSRALLPPAASPPNAAGTRCVRAGHPLALTCSPTSCAHRTRTSNRRRPGWNRGAGARRSTRARRARWKVTVDALRVAAFVRCTTEGVLAAVLGEGLARPLFVWLRSLGFMLPTPSGLVPHELVRDVLVADTLWRDLRAPMRSVARLLPFLRVHRAHQRPRGA